MKRIMSLWLCLQMLLSESLQKVFELILFLIHPSLHLLSLHSPSQHPPFLPTSSLPLIGSNTLITLTKFPFWIRFVFNGCLMLCGEIYY